MSALAQRRMSSFMANQHGHGRGHGDATGLGASQRGQGGSSGAGGAAESGKAAHAHAHVQPTTLPSFLAQLGELGELPLGSFDYGHGQGQGQGQGNTGAISGSGAGSSRQAGPSALPSQAQAHAPTQVHAHHGALPPRDTAVDSPLSMMAGARPSPAAGTPSASSRAQDSASPTAALHHRTSVSSPLVPLDQGGRVGVATGDGRGAVGSGRRGNAAEEGNR
jgi:hypothetical protein